MASLVVSVWGGMFQSLIGRLKTEPEKGNRSYHPN